MWCVSIAGCRQLELAVDGAQSSAGKQKLNFRLMNFSVAVEGQDPPKSDAQKVDTLEASDIN